MSEAPQRVGLYGGAFDPPHRAHVALAQSFMAQARLDCLHICPTFGAWHKTQTLSSAAHRLAMCELAFGNLSGAFIDAQEIERGGNSFTVDTLEQIHQRYPQAQLCLLIGQDQYRDLPRWHALPRIEQIATIFIAPRKVQSSLGSADREDLPNLASGYHWLQWQPVDDSATVVRERRRAGHAIDDLVMPDIARYIDDNHLYL